MKDKKQNTSLSSQLELEFNKSSQRKELNKPKPQVISLKDYSKKVLTAQALKATKSF